MGDCNINRLQYGEKILVPTNVMEESKLSNIRPKQYIERKKSNDNESTDFQLSSNLLNNIEKRLQLQKINTKNNDNDNVFNCLHSRMHDIHSGIGIYSNRKYETLYEQCQNIAQISQSEIMQRKNHRTNMTDATKAQTMHVCVFPCLH